VCETLGVAETAIRDRLTTIGAANIQYIPHWIGFGMVRFARVIALNVAHTSRSAATHDASFWRTIRSAGFTSIFSGKAFSDTE